MLEARLFVGTLNMINPYFYHYQAFKNSAI